MRLPSPIWGNRLGKTAIILVVLGAVAGTGWLFGHGAARPEIPPDRLPAANLNPNVISVEEGSIVSRLTVDAVVHADPPVQVRPEQAGTVTAVYRKARQRVNKGEALLAVKSTGRPQAPPAGNGSLARPAEPKPVTRVVRATATGVIAEMSAHKGQEVTPAEAVARIDQGRFQAVAKVDSKDVYRLYNKPESISLAIDHGPAPYRCPLIAYGAGVSTSTGPPPAKDQRGAPPGEGSSDSGGDEVQVICRIPNGQRVFAGIRAKMSITTDSVSDTTVVPLSAVLGEAESGRVTVVTDSGQHQVRTVKLGINDGKRVQILDGLKPGEKILDRAPQDAAFTAPPHGDDGPSPAESP